MLRAVFSLVIFYHSESLLPVSHLQVAEDGVQYLAGAVVELRPALARLQVLVLILHDLLGLGQTLEQLCYDLCPDRRLLNRILTLGQISRTRSHSTPLTRPCSL